jgi:hypothetical protein
MNFKNNPPFSYEEYEKKSQAKELTNVLHVFQVTLKRK